jgi:3-hydroxyacyl-[acyl-carrier-protein] dehydratase
VDVLSFRPRNGKIEGKAFVDGKLACEATLTCRVIPREREQRAAGDQAPEDAE